MTISKVSTQRRFEEMQARQREALRQEDLQLQATRNKTQRLRTLRLEKERQDEAEKQRLALEKRPAQAKRSSTTKTAPER